MSAINIKDIETAARAICREVRISEECWRSYSHIAKAALEAAPMVPKSSYARLAGLATDRSYMLEAVVQMLGPKGKEVWKMWQDNGVRRIHTSWGDGVGKLTGEEVAQTHLDLEAAPKTLIESID